LVFVYLGSWISWEGISSIHNRHRHRGTGEVLLKWKTAGNNVAPLGVVSTHLAKDWKTGLKKLTKKDVRKAYVNFKPS
jgi:hypothetical protein